MKNKTKKIIITVLIFTIAAIVMTLFLTDGFTVDRITGKAYNVQNVYDEIWNLMQLERQGQQTILTKYDPNSKRLYDFGQFEGIRVPICDAYVELSRMMGTLNILRPDDFHIYIKYDCRTKTLTIHGTQDEDYLIEEFMTYYFNCQNAEKIDTKYSLDNLGEYNVKTSPY